MPDSDSPGGTTVGLGDVLITEELARRPSRPPDYEAENRALVNLARGMATSPGSILQQLVDTALVLCLLNAGLSVSPAAPGGTLVSCTLNKS